MRASAVNGYPAGSVQEPPQCSPSLYKTGPSELVTQCLGSLFQDCVDSIALKCAPDQVMPPAAGESIYRALNERGVFLAKQAFRNALEYKLHSYLREVLAKPDATIEGLTDAGMHGLKLIAGKIPDGNVANVSVVPGLVAAAFGRMQFSTKKYDGHFRELKDDFAGFDVANATLSESALRNYFDADTNGVVSDTLKQILANFESTPIALDIKQSVPPKSPRMEKSTLEQRFANYQKQLKTVANAPLPVDDNLQFGPVGRITAEHRGLVDNEMSIFQKFAKADIRSDLIGYLQEVYKDQRLSVDQRNALDSMKWEDVLTGWASPRNPLVMSSKLEARLGKEGIRVLVQRFADAEKRFDLGSMHIPDQTVSSALNQVKKSFDWSAYETEFERLMTSYGNGGGRDSFDSGDGIIEARYMDEYDLAQEASQDALRAVWEPQKRSSELRYDFGLAIMEKFAAPGGERFIPGFFNERQ